MTVSTPDIQALIKEANRMAVYVADGGPDDGTVYTRLAAALSALSGETEADWEYGVLGTFVADGKFWDAWPVASIEAGNAEIAAMDPEPTDDTAVKWRVVQRTPEVKVKAGPWIEVTK